MQHLHVFVFCIKALHAKTNQQRQWILYLCGRWYVLILRNMLLTSDWSSSGLLSPGFCGLLTAEDELVWFVLVFGFAGTVTCFLIFRLPLWRTYWQKNQRTPKRNYAHWQQQRAKLYKTYRCSEMKCWVWVVFGGTSINEVNWAHLKKKSSTYELHFIKNSTKKQTQLGNRHE